MVNSDRRYKVHGRAKPVRVVAPVHQYIKRRSEEKDMTMSEYIDRLLPANDVVHGFAEDELSRIKVAPTVHDRIDRLSGQRIQYGNVVAWYVLLDMIDRGEAPEDLDRFFRDEIISMLWSEAESLRTQEEEYTYE